MLDRSNASVGGGGAQNVQIYVLFGQRHVFLTVADASEGRCGEHRRGDVNFKIGMLVRVRVRQGTVLGLNGWHGVQTITQVQLLCNI